MLQISSLPTRWRKSIAEDEEEGAHNEDPGGGVTAEVNGSQVCVTRQTPLDPQLTDKNTKYKKALSICTEISSLMSQTGGRQFKGRMKLLEDILKYWMSKKECVVLPMGPDGLIHSKLLVLL